MDYTQHHVNQGHMTCVQRQYSRPSGICLASTPWQLEFKQTRLVYGEKSINLRSVSPDSTYLHITFI